ncbi:hypothetical protein Kpol_2000p17 [Vanderwaltozyma polyspora DSM 70294]|uniref:ditrans,polycis-polyprenyl diphosphate synthase [(2E,6E)-farnesyldiphosphate specific] n=1 Tax=Vanderwaltozyma polyspora (strain ATCC 22028 / DSM 70294 / BCRC 21397 / CBS 2163 / NBRC 10782 / NRRL Y-8283 / UCD 57-17) TaxID=436907 RepID=A7TF28_VANPO|nr:uncharacterized protein Kpol_2000p17 [Vanderwaltozyma polyspora DSM 70294]EDO19053.1 hypothetical protein Kpol_2000p17 [Vanderwaltozyma polyspora DSM 70294]
MSKIHEKVLSKHKSEAERQVAASRHREPEASIIYNTKHTSKLNVLKSIADAMIVGDESNQNDPNFKAMKRDSFWVTQLHFIVFKILLISVYFVFGIFRYFQYQYNKMRLRVLNIIYNPTSTPQLIRQDVLKLSKVPKRLAAILDMKPIGEVGGGVKGIVNDASEIVCWTVSAGIKHLMLYDFDGVLKTNVQSLRGEIAEKLSLYFGPTDTPNFAIRIPHLNKVYYNGADDENYNAKSEKVIIEISLLSNRDGRETIVDLTRTMSELCLSHDLELSDITMKLIDTELTQLVGHEPDLLLYFGPALDLQGFPPWHIRLTEFHWEADNDQVSYLVFIRGLQKYSTCKINVGK